MLRVVLSVVLVLGAFSYAGADAKKPTFVDDVVPVLKQHCVTCHSDDKQKGGLNMATFGVTMQGGASGAVVTAGDPDKSRLYTMSAHKEEPKMPPKADKIPDAQLDVLRLWIEQGARENSGSKVNVPVKPKVDIGLKAITKGKPEGLPPMPQLGKLKIDPILRARRPGAVLALAASPWAPIVAVGGQKQVILYHANTGDLLGVLPFEHGQINSLKFSRNAKFLLAAGGRGGASGKAVLYNIETGAKVAEVGASETDAILSADISADQTMIAVGTTTRLVRVYAIADGSVVHQIKKHTDWVTSVEFSPDGVLLATGDRNGGVFVWESATAREFQSLRGHTAMITDLSWRADSNLLATASLDTTIKLWELENGGMVKNWAAHPGGVESVRFSMDGRIATTGRDKLTKLWDANGAIQKQFDAFADLGLRVTVSHDNTRVIAGDWSGVLKMWTIADAKTYAIVDTNPLPIAEQTKLTEQAVTAGEAKVKAMTDAFAAAQAKAKLANDAFVAAQANVAKLTAEMAATQKAVVDHTNVVNMTTPQVAPAKAEVDKWVGMNTATVNKAAALDVTGPIFADTAKKIQDAAAKAPQNPDLANAAKLSLAVAQQQTAELVVVKKAIADGAVALKAATDKQAALGKVIADNQAALTAAQAKVVALPPLVKAATDAVPPAKVVADTANGAVTSSKVALDAAVAELAATKAKLERLKSQGTVAVK